MSAVIPDWIVADRWAKMSANQKWNGLGALKAMRGIDDVDSNMANARGIPEPPKWVVPGVGDDIAMADIADLMAGVMLELMHEMAEDENRAFDLAARQAACDHTWIDTPYVDTKHCPKCGAISD